MISSTSSSSSRWLALAAGVLLGCGGSHAVRPDAAAPTSAASTAEPTPAARPRIAVFPVENVSGGSAPLRELRASIELAAARAGFEVVTGVRLDEFLARRRLRYTGGIDREAARAIGEELEVLGVLIASLELYQGEPAPQLAYTMRLVSATADARVLWVDGISRTGDEAPGLLGLGVMTRMPDLETEVLSALMGSLADALGGRGPSAPACPDGGRYGPKIRYRAPSLAAAPGRSVAVVPFRSFTRRRNAGDVVALEFVRQLTATPGFRVVEPGVVRESLLRHRIVMEGGVSVDQVRVLLGALDADLVVAGEVFEFGEASTGGAPNVNFSATIFDARTGRIVWQSTSFNRGDEGVFFFGLGTIRTPSALVCRMIRSAADDMLPGGR